MESCKSRVSKIRAKCCNCGCSCSSISRSLSGTNFQSFKRKHVELEEEDPSAVSGPPTPSNARVELENECKALRETVASQQQTLKELTSELEQERSASSSAANEAMSMILKLQKEKAEIEMELRQFERFAEEKIAHDEQEMGEVEELLYKREHAIEALNCEVQAYKHRLMSFGMRDDEVDEVNSSNGEKIVSQNASMTDLEGQFELPGFEIYPRLKCKINESRVYRDGDDGTETFRTAFGHTPYSRDQLKDLEFRINELEQSPRTTQPDGAKSVFETLIASQSPMQPRHLRKFSTEDYSPFKGICPDYATESPKLGASFKKTVYTHLDLNSNLRKVDNASEFGDDNSDRVYTIDFIHRRASVNGAMDMTTPRADMRELEIQKLYARLHALEADREAMRQAIVSVRTDKAQMVLLKEIAQNLCKEMSPVREMPVLTEQTNFRSISIKSIFNWILPFVFWRRKARRSRYTFGLSANNAGLLLFLDRSSHAIGYWRSISTTRM